MAVNESVSIAKIYIRSIAAIVCTTSAISFGAYLGQITEPIWVAYIAGAVACVLFDKPPVLDA